MFTPNNMKQVKPRSVPGKALMNKDRVGSLGVGQRKNRIKNDQNYCSSDAPSLGFSYVAV